MLDVGFLFEDRETLVHRLECLKVEENYAKMVAKVSKLDIELLERAEIGIRLLREKILTDIKQEENTRVRHILRIHNTVRWLFCGHA
jgi:hypothetical protein